MHKKVLAGAQVLRADDCGPDPFGLRVLSNIPFHRPPLLNGTPHPDEFETVFEQLNRATHSGDMNSVSPVRLMPDDAPISRCVHVILLGNSLDWFASICPGVRENIQSWQRHNAGITTVLWTDLTEASPGYADMRTWCAEHNIKLVNVYDVFSGNETMHLFQPFLVELGKRQYGAASDILRYAILLRFGGVYGDLDDKCTAPLQFWTTENYRFSPDECDPKGLYLWPMCDGDGYNNSIMAAPPRHPVIARLIESVRCAYTHPLALSGIYPKAAEMERVLHLSGPTRLTRVLKEMGIVPLKPFGTLSKVTHSWVRRQKLPTLEDSDALAKVVITNLLFDLTLTPKRLNLSRYKDWLAGMPDPDGCEDLIVSFLLDRYSHLLAKVEVVICARPVVFERVQTFLKDHFDITLDPVKQLIHAAAWGNTPLLDMLVERGHPEEACQWYQVLRMAVHSHHIPTIQKVLALCPHSVDRKALLVPGDFNGSILHIAVETGDLPFVDQLLACFPKHQDWVLLDEALQEMGSCEFLTAAALAQWRGFSAIQARLEEAGFRNNLK